MRNKLLHLCRAFLLLCLAVHGVSANTGGVSAQTMEKYQKAKQQLETAAGTKAAKYAPEMLKAAGESVNKAQNGLKSGNDKETLESAEMALLQIKLAGALQEERIAAEKTAAAERELTSFQQRLSQILAGKGDKL